MAPRSVLFAGDFNMEPLRDMCLEPSIDVLCVPGARLVNDKTGFVSRLVKELTAGQLKHLFLHIGSNDVNESNVCVIERCYKKVLDQVNAIAPTCTVTICEVLPRGQNNNSLQDKIEGINAMLAKFSSRCDINVLSYSALFESKVHLARDGLHVNRAGAFIIRDVLLSGLAEAEYFDHPSSNHLVKEEKPVRSYAEVAAMPAVISTAHDIAPLKQTAGASIRSNNEEEKKKSRPIRRAHYKMRQRRRRRYRSNSVKHIRAYGPERVTIPLTDDVAVSVMPRLIHPILKGKEPVSRNMETTCTAPQDSARKESKLNASVTKVMVCQVMMCPLCPKTFTGDLFLLDHFAKRHNGSSNVSNGMTCAPKRRKPRKNPVQLTNKCDFSFPSSQTRKEYSQTYKQKLETNAAAFILDFTYKEWSEIYSIMMLEWLFGFEGLCFLLENLGIRHCSNAIRCRLLLSGDVEQNPGPGDSFQCLWDSCEKVDFNSLRSLAQHVISHLSEKPDWCCWNGCVFHSEDEKHLERHALQHIYLDPSLTRNLNTLEGWGRELPNGEFNHQSTNLHLCPIHLRAKFEILLLDECFQLPKKEYSLFDHECFLQKMKEQRPQEFFALVEDFIQQRSAKGDVWEFNKEKWIKDGHSLYKAGFEGPSENNGKVCDSAQKLDIYCVESNVSKVKEPIVTNRPELVGSFQSNVRFKFHENSGSSPNSVQHKRKSVTETVDSTGNEPWIDNVICNLTRCQEAIELERKVLNNIIDKKFLSSNNKCLVTCEEKAFSLATYPSCTEGVFFFSIICANIEQSDTVPQLPNYYVRYIESGCYADFMSQVVLPIIARGLNIDISRFLLSQISTTSDIQNEQRKLNVKLESAKRTRPDKIFKSNCSKLKNSIQQTLASAQESNIDLRYFLHFVRKGCKVSIDKQKSEDWYITSNFAENIQEDIVSKIKEYPLTRLEGNTKTAYHFTEEIVPRDASLSTQSKFLNYLSNDHYVNLKGKPLYFLDRFPVSYIPASFRNKILCYFMKRRYGDILELFKDSVPQLSSNSKSMKLPSDSNSVSLEPKSKRRRTNIYTIRSKTITKEMVQESINITTDLAFGDISDPLSLYDNYKRQIIQFGTLHIQVSKNNEMIAIMNNYDDEEGYFKKYDYVYTGRVQTETGFTFTCSCKIYRTLLECVDNTDNTPFDTLDTSSGVKCVHCRFFNSEIVPNLDLSQNATTTQIQMKVQNALSSLGQSVIQLEGKPDTRKFSVLTDDIPSFVHLSWCKSTRKYIISCLDGFCRSQKGAKKNVDNFMTGDVCQHLLQLKEKPEFWKGFTTAGDKTAGVVEDEQEEDFENEFPEADIDCAPDSDVNTESDVNFDDVTGLWSFKCLSTHSARQESSPELAKNVQERDYWNDRNPDCIPRLDGCLKGPDLMEPIPEFKCLCSAGWKNDEFPNGKILFDRNIVIYTDNAPVQCKVFTRLCVRHSGEPCKLKWDEGASMCIHVVTRESAAGDEIGWAFVNQVLTSRTTFSSFCGVKNRAYKLRDPNSRNFMHKDVFIKWWFSWAANRNIDFRKPCPVCKYSPKQLACDGTKVGIGFRHASFEPINRPTQPDIIHPTLHRRMDRCFLPNSQLYSKQTMSSCRTHMHYLAAAYLKELKTVDILPDEEVVTRNVRLQEVLPLEILPSFNRFLTTMDNFEKTAYASLFKLLATTAPLGSLLPADFIRSLRDLVDHLTGAAIQPNGDDFFNSAMQSLRYYAPEIRNLIANSMHCNKDDDGNPKLHEDILMLLRYIIDRVLNLPLEDFEPALVQVGTYNPMKYGRAYYFSPSGCKLRNVRKFSIDLERDNNNNFDDVPMDFELCRKYFSKTHIAARGSTSLFLWFCPNHGHCYGFHMALAEGRKDPFASLYSHLENPPKDIFYDFACNLHEYCLNRESAYYHKVRFFHDIFHGYSHKCSVAYKSSRLFGFQSINSEICEQFNSFLQCIKASAIQMNQKHFCFYLQFFLHIWNEKKYSKFQKRLNVAVAGF